MPSLPDIGERRPKPTVAKLTRVRKAVFERDDWTCQYCGLVIPPRRAEEFSGRYAPMLELGFFLELDHIVPWTVGGLFEPDNLRAACSRCNRSKGASTESADWPARLARARVILEQRPATAATARAVMKVLTGGGR